VYGGRSQPLEEFSFSMEDHDSFDSLKEGGDKSDEPEEEEE
jgi:hypothetical protein